uniref:TPX2 C-terminal domain-containing protein n=1 Tax=Lactuca sativa TaxID=4236 RepID=A0A9R1WK52_LACSA|nr:hypothetical protein LSAT_V11C200075970 [Lactuca sativa]
METPRIKTSHKYVKNTSYSSDAVRSPTRPVKSDPSSLPIKTKTSVITTKTSIKENMKPEYVKFQTLAKENTKSMEVKLQTKERAVKRAFFNYSMIEEEEVRMLRKEMIPRAQLMPLFDRPFFPRRSTTPTKAAKKSSSQETHRNSFSCAQEFYNFRENEAR